MRAIPSSLPVMVTGASSGIGEEFARQFAERGHDLTLVARRLDRLQALAQELNERWKVTATPLEADLSVEQGVETALAVLRESGPWILVNNAGFGSRGSFASLDRRVEFDEVALNVTALHRLTAEVLPKCVEFGEGGVVNVASTAAFQPLPYMATYAATKAFVLHFTEGLAGELRGSGVRVQALCPGPTRTEFETVAGGLSSPFAKMAQARAMTAEKVVRASLKAFDRNRTICVPGISNQFTAQSPRLAPRALVRRITGPLFKP